MLSHRVGCAINSEIVATHHQFAVENPYASESAGSTMIKLATRSTLFHAVFAFPTLTFRWRLALIS